jgi:hypothetical protein
MTDKEEIEILQARIDELKGVKSGPPKCFHCGGSGEVAWEGTCYYCVGSGYCYPPNDPNHWSNKKEENGPYYDQVW